ncbi:uncharacterized protein N7515_009192 [Penicillium bovifimosum]|uniref:Uncharacterized protein n=1 Tax=Penicillium bovifimosum TaxID=126998 RepID=A0A9W9GJ65_9EURO|nr:uncharacterized protein N7515_009192 [Penicillium bovifimosum]KAJ5121231.1 hypothetical protein N7515_009192 [Penicillium bovifimosum]
MRKATERGEAQLDGHGGTWLVAIVAAAPVDPMSLSVNVRKAAGHVVAQLVGDGGGRPYRRHNSNRSNVSVCERAEGRQSRVVFPPTIVKEMEKRG